jgi:2-amino-4-hydroxy-6-hydroxymethyldihydropteridine diphosphokinase
MSHSFLGLGANLGDRRANLRAALRRIGAVARIVAVSSLYESAAVVPEGEPPGPDYLNAVCAVETELPPAELLRALKAVEHDMGRDMRAPRWSARPIDIDILLYGDLALHAGDLDVPHPRLRERPFVLVPLAEIAPDVVVPGDGRTIGELAAGADLASLRHVEDPAWAWDVAG